jgi:flavin reductase (DIM6/NTAB) family NADH-FMN oxidoreductase RutF
VTQSHFYEPPAGHRLAHDPLKAIIAPRPIGWISSIDASGAVNLAPYSFFNMVSDDPPMVMFSSNGWKDSVRNVSETGEFVANLAVRALAEPMNLTSVAVPHDVDEMDLARLEKAPSVLVKPPRVAAAPAALECTCVSIQRLRGIGGGDASTSTRPSSGTASSIRPPRARSAAAAIAATMPRSRACSRWCARPPLVERPAANRCPARCPPKDAAWTMSYFDSSTELSSNATLSRPIRPGRS